MRTLRFVTDLLVLGIAVVVMAALYAGSLVATGLHYAAREHAR